MVKIDFSTGPLYINLPINGCYLESDAKIAVQKN